MKKSVNILLISTILFTASCGTILYPERKGQAAGKIDPAVAILNGVGTLLFFIPGIIAFAVDFNNGAIYLPGADKKVKKVKRKFSSVDEEYNKKSIQQVVASELALAKTMNLDSMKIRKIDNVSKANIFSY